MYAGDRDFAPLAENNDTPICDLLARPHALCWYCQFIEADTVIRQTGMLPWSSLPLRWPAPYL
jgi:hypothetical protein